MAAVESIAETAKKRVGVAVGNVAALTKSAPSLYKDSVIAARTHLDREVT